MSGRTSFWIRTFHEARTTLDWVCVPRLYTRATAAQLASRSEEHTSELQSH